MRCRRHRRGVRHAPVLRSAAQTTTRWLRTLAGDSHRRPLAAIVARAEGMSRHVVARVLAGKTRPRLPQLLALIDAITGRVTEWIDCLVGVDAVAAMADEHYRRGDGAGWVFDTPWATGVRELARLQAYRELHGHVDGWFAERLGVPLEVERAAIHRLLQAGAMVADAERLVVADETLVLQFRDASHGSNPIALLAAHWAGVAADLGRVRHGHDAAAFTWGALSRENYRRVLQLLDDFVAAVGQIADQPQPREHVVLWVSHLLDLTGPRPPRG